eukprot:6536540-Pyramimonas_sp.AAC.1
MLATAPLDDAEHGYARARPRSEAIAVGLALQWRPQRISKIHITAKHDMTNAFASVARPILDAAVDQIYFPGDCAIMKGRRRRAACVISDGINA